MFYFMPPRYAKCAGSENYIYIYTPTVAPPLGSVIKLSNIKMLYNSLSLNKNHVSVKYNIVSA